MAAAETPTGAADEAVDEAPDTLPDAPPEPTADGASAAAALALARRRLELVREEWLAMRRSGTARTTLVELLDIGDTAEAIVGAGVAAEDLTALLRRLGERLPDGAALAAELAEVERAHGALQAERFRWSERLRERAIDDPAGVLAASLALSPLGERVDPDGPPGSGPRPRSGRHHLPPHRARRRRQPTLRASRRRRDRAGARAWRRAAAVGTFLERSLLGLRSRDAAGLAWIGRVPGALRWLADGTAWRAVGETLASGLRLYPARAVAFVALVGALLLLRSRLRRRLGDLSSRVGHVGRDGFWVTPLALLTSALRASPVPLLVGFVGLQLALPLGEERFVPALGESLSKVAPVLFVLLLGRALGRRDGVLHAHFGWSEAAALQLRRHLLWLCWAVLGLALPIVLTLSGDVGTGADTGGGGGGGGALDGPGALRAGLGVPAFLAASIALAAFVDVVFHPSRGIAARIVPDTPPARVMIALHLPLVLVPLAIGALPLAGYLDTAADLQLRAFASLLLVMLVVLVHGLAVRTFAVAQRRFALRRARRARARLLIERRTLDARPVSGEAVPSGADEEHPMALDVERVARQVRTILLDVAVLLLLLGLWLVWRSLFPTFGAADGIVLWPGTAAPGAAEAEALGEGGLVDGVTGGVTLRNVVVALFLITVGLIASRNIRGLLELVVFERLRLDAGARYAIVAVSGYVLVGASLVAGLSQLGVDWSKLQWIVAALGVGLGFGLQEIVANFVSGLIILFERPVRVGDVVTIGNLTGTISNIRIRATTLTDFDNLEVLLPNKTIITENVTNWTLSDSVTRLLLTIGVAHGSDVERVRTLLEGAIAATADILDEPAATVFFVRHGDSALQFELRVFVATPAHRLPVTHELNGRIGEALAGAGIEIPFPQRSVTLRHAPAPAG